MSNKVLPKVLTCDEARMLPDGNITLSKEIIPTVITVEDVLGIPDAVLCLLPSISTGIVLDKINTFIKRNIESSNEILKAAAIRLQAAYEELNATNAYLASDEAKDLSETLYRLRYDDISVNTSLDTLKTYRALILELLSEDEEFINSYTNEKIEKKSTGTKVAYTTKLDSKNLENVLEKMLAVSECNILAFQLRIKIQNNKNLFRNARLALNNKTVLRKAIYKKDKLINILKGLDFLIPRLESGQSPATWRRL